MIYFTIIFLTIVIILFTLKEKNLTNPTVIFSGIWLISLGLTSLKLYNMISYSTKSILIVTMGIISFVNASNKGNYIVSKWNSIL